MFLEQRKERTWKQLSLEHYYLAQIACEIVRMAIKPEDAKMLRLEDFLIKFKSKEQPRELTPQEKKEYIKQQKCLFAGIFGAPLPEDL